METAKDQFWKILQYNVDWLKYAETKATVVLTFNGVIFSLVFAHAKELLPLLGKNYFLLVIAILWFLSGITSIVFIFISLFPKVKNSNRENVIFYGHILRNSTNYEDYFEKAKVNIGDEELITKGLSEQIYTNSHIAMQKFKNINLAIKFLITNISLVLLEALIISILISVGALS